MEDAMQQRFSAEELWVLRNKISIAELIRDTLKIPSKTVEGVFRFLCPVCGEFQTGVNPRTNLSRCFRCQRNFNSIEIVMQDYHLTFVESVKFLKALMGHNYQAATANGSTNANEKASFAV